MKTFQCSFGNGVSCVLQTTDEVPPKGKTHIQEVIWSGKPNKSVIRPYVAWINSVNKSLADEWGVKLMHIFQISKGWKEGEAWVYEPGKLPKRVRKWRGLEQSPAKQQE